MRCPRDRERGSLANTKEPLFILNRPGNRPSHEDAAVCFDKAIVLCRQAGFESILCRGDTDFSQTAHLDRWDDQKDVQFLFGMDATARLIYEAEGLADSAWKRLDRPAKYEVATQQRARPINVKEKIVADRLFTNLKLCCEHVAQFEYQPVKCQRPYRVVVCRKTIDTEVGQQRLFDECRYFFYITNDRQTPADELVLQANGRCDQENLIEQLKNGVRAMQLPVDTLVANWAYMVMASLAWSLKAWWGLMLPAACGRWREQHQSQKHDIVRMEFKRFVTNLIRLPAQILKTGRRLVYRLLSYNPWQSALLRAAEAWRARAQC